MNYAVYMKSKSEPYHRVLLGLFLMKEDAEVFLRTRVGKTAHTLIT